MWMQSIATFHVTNIKECTCDLQLTELEKKEFIPSFRFPTNIIAPHSLIHQSWS
jgi:hypothetical protein